MKIPCVLREDYILFCSVSDQELHTTLKDDITTDNPAYDMSC